MYLVPLLFKMLEQTRIFLLRVPLIPPSSSSSHGSKRQAVVLSLSQSLLTGEFAQGAFAHCLI